MNESHNDRQLFKQVLPLVLDGEADELQQQFVQSQIENCTYCKSVYEHEKAVLDIIRTKTYRATPPQDLAPQIQNIISQQLQSSAQMA